ncbi:MAG: hypothetical protein AB8I08_15380 [Sandaracinaceae bacterium]
MSSATDVTVEVGRGCDDFIICIDEEDDGSAIEAAAPSFVCTPGLNPACSEGQIACTNNRDLEVIDAAEFAEICAADAARQPSDVVVCAVYL